MPVDLRDPAPRRRRQVHAIAPARRAAGRDPAQRRQAGDLLLPPADDDEPAAVIELDDDEARQLGAIIGGAYERPKIVEELEMALGELHDRVDPRAAGSPAIGQTLADAGSARGRASP